MAQKRTLSFKLFLQSEGGTEVRRINIDLDVISGFNYLREKLRAVFPLLYKHDFTMAWKDSDGYSIDISNNEELRTALTEQQTEVLKIYVTLRDESEKQGDKDQNQKHAGITCDGCQKAVEGFRYKCIQCPNFDLCATCESKGFHPKHYMIRLPVPISWFNDGYCQKIKQAGMKEVYCITKVLV